VFSLEACICPSNKLPSWGLRPCFHRSVGCWPPFHPTTSRIFLVSLYGSERAIGLQFSTSFLQTDLALCKFTYALLGLPCFRSVTAGEPTRITAQLLKKSWDACKHLTGNNSPQNSFCSYQITDIRNKPRVNMTRIFWDIYFFLFGFLCETIGFFSRIVALGSTQPLTEMSTRNLPEGKGRPAGKVYNFTAICEPIV
jgi:hypothetical protein